MLFQALQARWSRAGGQRPGLITRQDELQPKPKGWRLECGGGGFTVQATLEATQWQIVGQSPTDATRLWLTEETIDLPLVCL